MLLPNLPENFDGMRCFVPCFRCQEFNRSVYRRACRPCLLTRPRKKRSLLRDNLGLLRTARRQVSDAYLFVSLLYRAHQHRMERYCASFSGSSICVVRY
jgi:hypothetical protein